VAAHSTEADVEVRDLVEAATHGRWQSRTQLPTPPLPGIKGVEMVEVKAGGGPAWPASINRAGDVILARDAISLRLAARMAEPARILALLPRAAEVSEIAVSPRATKSLIPVIRVATRIRIAEAADSVDKIKTVVAGLVDAKFLRSRSPEVAQQDEMAAVTRVPTVGLVAADAVKPKPGVARRRAAAMTRVSAARARVRARATAVGVQKLLAQPNPRRPASTSLKKTRLPIH
jgi:hypothetical protein